MGDFVVSLIGLNIFSPRVLRAILVADAKADACPMKSDMQDGTISLRQRRGAAATEGGRLLCGSSLV